MKLLKKTLGLFLAFALALCSVFALSACEVSSGTDGSSSSKEDENRPLTEAEKIALKNELYAAMDNQTNDINGMEAAAQIKVTQGTQAISGEITGALAIAENAVVNADLYYYGPEDDSLTNVAGGVFLRDETVYVSTDVAESKAALISQIADGQMPLVFRSMEDLLAELGQKIGGQPDYGYGEVYDEDYGEDYNGDSYGEDYMLSVVGLVMAYTQEILPVLAVNAETLIGQSLNDAALGSADKTEDGYVLTVTFSELLDSLASAFIQVATTLDSCNSKPVTEVWDVAEVKALVETLFDGVTAKQLDGVVRGVCEGLGYDFEEIIGSETTIVVTDETTVTEYLKSITAAFFPNMTFGELVAALTESIMGEATTLTALATMFSAVSAMIKQIISVEISFQFDSAKQIVACSLAMTLNTAIMDPTDSVKVEINATVTFPETAPELLDLTDAVLVEYIAPSEVPGESSEELPVEVVETYA